MLRLDLLLAGDERDAVHADPGGDLVVDLARKQPQRQADQPRVVAEHALDRQVRLARVGGPEHGRHVADASFEIADHRGMLLIVPAGHAWSGRSSLPQAPGIALGSAEIKGLVACTSQ